MRKGAIRAMIRFVQFLFIPTVVTSVVGIAASHGCSAMLNCVFSVAAKHAGRP